MNIKTYGAILQGWKEFIWPSKKIEEQARERAKICAQCPHANPEHPFKRWIPEENRIEMIKGLGCDICGCPLSSKLRQVLEGCPEKKW
jgi:flavoprotein